MLWFTYVSMCELRITILGIVLCVIIMGVNWKNLIKIELDELNEVQYSQSARTIDASRISRIQLYTPVQLHDIGNMVKHDRRLNKLPPMTVKMIRHL